MRLSQEFTCCQVVGAEQVRGGGGGGVHLLRDPPQAPQPLQVLTNAKLFLLVVYVLAASNFEV